MKASIIFSIVVSALPLAAFGGQIQFEFEDLENFTDFSVSGMTEERTLGILESELKSDVNGWEKRLAEDQVLTIRFLDIDMAGDIQPWRNPNNADIRYVEAIYPPRLKFSYTLADAEGNILQEGEEALTDLAYQTNVAATVRRNHDHFVYERELLANWIRRTFRN